MIIFQESQKVRQLRASYLLKQTNAEDLNSTLQEVKPILTEALNAGPDFYGQIKEYTLNEVQQLHGDEAVIEVKQMFEQFEVEYLREQLESMRPLLEIAQAFGGQSELEKVEEDLIRQLSDVLEEGSIEVIKEYFESIYTTQLLKKLKLIKQEAGTEAASVESNEALTMEQEFEQIIPILTEILNIGLDQYAQIKQETLLEIKQQNGEEASQQARELFEQFEIDYTQRTLEKMRSQFENIKYHEGEEGIQSYEKTYIEEVTPYFEPAVIEEIQKFFQELHKTINLQRVKIIGLWGWSDFSDWAKGAYDDTKNWAKKAYNDTQEWTKDTYQKGKE